MPKRIVVCSDGTGNAAIKGRGTNVFKLFEAVDLNGHTRDPKLTPQVAIYDDGVGAEDFKLLKIVGGAFGLGLSRNVKDLYRELVRIYDEGDEIYVFGFSRGAFTVRTLVGFIATCGLVDRKKLARNDFAGLRQKIDDAYSAYRKCYRPWLWRIFGKPTRDAGDTFKKAHSLTTDVRVRFVGVWDTVDAVGLPFHIADFWNATFYQFKFSDHKLSTIVDRACHALSIDDPRQSFTPVLWDESGDEDRITQVWFAGVHSNVGGGYPKQGMSLVALDWMLTEAGRPDEKGKKGLRTNETEREYFRDHANVDDKLYDPRAGLGIFYRWKIRDIAKLCRDHKLKPRIHLTALERIAHGTDDYAPGNLPSDAEVVITQALTEEAEDLLDRRAQGVEQELRTIPGGMLLNQVRFPMAVGTVSYYVYLIFCTAVVITAAGVDTGSFARSPLIPLITIGKFVFALVTDFQATLVIIGRQLLNRPELWFVLLSGFVLAYAMMLFADNRMEKVFSRFWYGKQEALRDALKKARADAKREGPRPPHGPGATQPAPSKEPMTVA